MIEGMNGYEPHIYRTGPKSKWGVEDAELSEPTALRKSIEPWLTSVFQSEHFSLLLGSGFSNAVVVPASVEPADMGGVSWPTDLQSQIQNAADRLAKNSARGAPNVEDEIRAAMYLLEGLKVLGDKRANEVDEAISSVLSDLEDRVLRVESDFRHAQVTARERSEHLLISFLISFASRAAARERLSLFTTNYDRFIEYGCDLAGLRAIDRFVGSLEPVFRTTRLEVDMHYNPPGIRGEPRFLEGVMHFAKLHGSLDWSWSEGQIRKKGVPFGGPSVRETTSGNTADSLIVYPNPAKDMETLNYPYSELFRDFSAAVCRPNSALVTYGYGFGDSHINRVMMDMLTIPSTHLVVISWDQADGTGDNTQSNASRTRLLQFLEEAGRESQISLLVGEHFGDLHNLVRYYLPKPAIDPISMRQTKLKERRGEAFREAPEKEQESDELSTD